MDKIQERNKEIALMMGYKITLLDRLFYTYKLRFLYDWELLMEVVEFIENIRDRQGYGNVVNIWSTGCNICENNAGHKIIENTFATSKREAVFIAVSNFAKLYNEKKL